MSLTKTQADSQLASPPPHQHILRPVTGEARVSSPYIGSPLEPPNPQVILNKSMSSSTPKIDAQVMFDEIGVVVDRDQYRNTLSVVDVFQFYHRTHQYHKYRPSEAEYEANVHRARLMFALRAIAAEVHDRHRRWTWEYLAERRDMRKKYVDIYVRKLASTEKTLLVQVSISFSDKSHN
jgi:vacuolar protein sorting-associated protein 13A/C